MKNHPFVEKYNQSNYQPKVYNFLADFNPKDIFNLQSTLEQQGASDCLTQASNLVHNTYNYRRRQRGRLALNNQKIENTKQIDCYGYAIALSQVLETLGVDHRLAFANTHSFIIASDQDTIFVADAFLPCLTGRLDPTDICHTDCFKKGVFSIDMFNHAKNNCQLGSANTFLRANPWVRFSQHTNRLGSNDRGELLPTANPTLIARAFEPAEGIKTLYAFDGFKVAVENNHLSKAYFLSKVLSNTYPELDIRNNPKTAEKLIERLGQLGLSTLATQTIENIAYGRTVANTVAPGIWRAKAYAKLGKITKLAVYYDTSAGILTDLLKDPGLKPSQKSAILGKLGKLLKITPTQ